MSVPGLRLDGPRGAAVTVALAHGAGAPMDSPFLRAVTEGLVAAGHRVARFEFPYMRRRRAEGGRRPPDRLPVLEATWSEVIAELRGQGALVIGGKSMGGRVATRVADRAGVAGVVCLGYPFHPPGRPDRLRTAHLAELTTPTLMVQGTRDRFGTAEEVAGYALSPAVRVAWIEDGDHSLKPRKRSGRTAEEALEEALAAVGGFLEEVAP